MSADKRIAVELTEAEARRFLDITAFDGAEVGVVRDRIAAALQPEYPEGTVAWVTFRNGNRWLAQQRSGKWRLDAEGSAARERELTKVEPLRVLADHEIAVERILTWVDWREMADRDIPVEASNLALVYADALEAEARS